LAGVWQSQKTGADSHWLTFAAAGVSFAADVDTVYRNCGGAVFGGGM